MSMRLQMDDPCWASIRKAHAHNPELGFDDLRIITRLGSGDIGSVYLAELKCARGHVFAAKVMDKQELVTRKKESRAGVERKILQMLDHPFLPRLYATLDSPDWSCLLTEFCPGGDLHVCRQRQPNQCFDEAAVRFYASEVVVALEYLHMKGIIYRDLKPENVLVRSDGHIMLTDFDLSLKDDNPTTSTAQIVSRPSSPITTPFNHHHRAKSNSSRNFLDCMLPSISCSYPLRKKVRPRSHRTAVEIVMEPVELRSMSFVGTHEYLAPEVITGEGHGNAVDWWTLGIFIYEMFYGTTPFKGAHNERTLANIIARGLEFPQEPAVSARAKDLMEQLLHKDPSRRMGSTMGANAVKHHPFFGGVNWALLRCTEPPFVPKDNSCASSVEFVKEEDCDDVVYVDYY